MDRTHPEGISFVPTGHGFTTNIEPPRGFDTRLGLLNEKNVKAVLKNHPLEWDAAYLTLPSRTRDFRTGRASGLTDDERRRLATLAVLIEHGMFIDDRSTEARHEGQAHDGVRDRAGLANGSQDVAQPVPGRTSD